MHTDRSALDAWLQRADEVLEDTIPGDEPLLGKVWATLAKERDLVLHLRAGWFGGEHFTQLVDYTPSTGEYDSIFLVRSDLLPDLIRYLVDLAQHVGTAR